MSNADAPPTRQASASGPVADADYVSDVHAFGDANHMMLVVGTSEEGFRLWCGRCDRMGTRIYRSLAAAQHVAAASKKDIAPICLPERAR